MKLFVSVAALVFAISGAGIASAQMNSSMHHDDAMQHNDAIHRDDAMRHDAGMRHDDAMMHHGDMHHDRMMTRHHRHCSWQWRHHHRVRTCR